MLWALKHHLGPWAYEEHCIAFVSDVRKKLFHLVNQQCQVAHSYFILLFEVVSRWKFFFRLSVTPMQVLRSEQYSSAQISTEWLSTATVVSDDVFRLWLQTMTSGYVFRLCDADWSGFCPEVPSYLDGQVVCWKLKSSRQGTAGSPACSTPRVRFYP